MSSPPRAQRHHRRVPRRELSATTDEFPTASSASPTSSPPRARRHHRRVPRRELGKGRCRLPSTRVLRSPRRMSFVPSRRLARRGPSSNDPVFLPTTADEVRARGWSELDVVIVSGDAYVDHPAFGPVLI